MNSGMESSLRARVRCLVLVFCSVPGGVGVYPNLIAAGVLGPVQRHVAAASNSNRSLPCWPSTATPIETATLMRASAAATLGVAASALSRSAIPYAPAPSVRGNSTVNSSLQKDMSVVAERVVAPHGWLRYDFERIRSVRHL